MVPKADFTLESLGDLKKKKKDNNAHLPEICVWFVLGGAGA